MAASDSNLATLWVVCGAGRGVGKTHLAQRLRDTLPDAIYAKQGCGERRPDGPPNFFRSEDELQPFLDEQRRMNLHVVVESNEMARQGRGDVIVFIDGAPSETDLRDDVDELRAAAHLHVTADASVRTWKRTLKPHVEDGPLREAVCDCLMEQKQFLLRGRPEVRVKLWFMRGGMHVFGAGLARLLTQIDRHGTLREAAKAAHMSYRHAWGLIRNAEKHHGTPLIKPQTGGVGGGQSILSDHGRTLLRKYQDLQTRIHVLADACFAETTTNEPLDPSMEPVTPVSDDPLAGTLRAIQPLRISTAGAASVRQDCEVVVERPLTVMIKDVGSFTIMCTPNDVEALAMGFAHSEGMITHLDDVVSLKQTNDPLTIAMEIDDPQAIATRRNLLVTSSCGLCGQRNIESVLEGVTIVGDTLRVSGQTLLATLRRLRETQAIFQRSGGTHAAALFDNDGTLVSFGEDIGRHNALDKAIGQCLLREQPTGHLGAALSGRVSLELVAKAARAGIEIIAAISAPSSAAIEAANRANITLCGFVRDTRATIYSHQHRIIGP